MVKKRNPARNELGLRSFVTRNLTPSTQPTRGAALGQGHQDPCKRVSSHQDQTQAVFGAATMPNTVSIDVHRSPASCHRRLSQLSLARRAHDISPPLGDGPDGSLASPEIGAKSEKSV